MNQNEVYEVAFEPKWQKIISSTYQSIVASGDVRITNDELTELLDGCFDTHIHAAPDSYGWRVLSEADVARKAVDCRFGGVVFKCQSAPSSCRQLFVQELADMHADATGKRRVAVFSGVCCSTQVGGYNPAAVEASFKMGGKYVWTPSKDAAHHHRAEGNPVPGVECIDEAGRLLPNVLEILKLVAENDGVLGLSHNSAYERFLLAKTAQEMGVQRIVVEHPMVHISRLTEEQMAEFFRMGVYLGMTYIGAVPNFIVPEVDKTEAARLIKKFGPARWVSQTDLTQLQTQDPVEGIRTLAKMLLSQGISEDDIRKIFVDNPRELLF